MNGATQLEYINRPEEVLKGKTSSSLTFFTSSIKKRVDAQEEIVSGRMAVDVSKSSSKAVTQATSDSKSHKRSRQPEVHSTNSNPQSTATTDSD